MDLSFISLADNAFAEAQPAQAFPMTTLGNLLKQEQERRQASDRQVSRETGISPTTISRIKAGYKFEWPTMVKLCQWLGVNPSTVMDTQMSAASEQSGPISTEALAVQLEFILANSPRLYEKFAGLVTRIIAGEIPLHTFAEAINYATFRASMEDDRGPGIYRRREADHQGD